ncbi:hypothetical protein Vafri_18749 [Volvox africanus]|uniref:Amine oxidase domain-containing protein n=1 Tax=Volvox africanus TaxID=51714 RepID=A0A8J4BN61_9CHLO|nr:hypothetical protein Vafri_18749 [Volvox africanus]
MHCLRNVRRVCRQPHGTHPAAPATPCAVPLRLHVRTAASGNALVVGGGFAGLAAADVLATAGLNVVIVEQGRGLGGRMCTRTVTLGSLGERITFDHGCQYLTARNSLFGAVLNDLHERGAVAQWGLGQPVGTAHLAEDGTVDMSTFTADASKALWVGTPTNSRVGRALAAISGPGLTALTATRVEQLHWDVGKGMWTCRARQTAAANSGDNASLSRLESTSFDFVVTAMSSVSTARLLSSSSSSSPGGQGGSSGSSGSSGSGEAHGPLAADVVAAAAAVQSNVCWALMVALNKKIDVPFDGALLSRQDPAGGAVPLYGPIAWLARDSSKPGRPLVAGGAGECWVVHGGPDWSDARRGAAPADVAQELLRDFAHLVQTRISADDVIHVEAHRWNNAYPLNPRPPHPPSPPPKDTGRGGIGGGGGGGGGGVEVPLTGYYMIRPEMRLGVCGDWCKGPRAADAYVTGWEAANALLRL